jgi:hypothetical protein
VSSAPVPQQYRAPATSERIALIAQSFERLLKRPLVAPDDDLVAALWAAPCAVVAHGTEADPVFFFGNAWALAAFECEIAQFTRMPSRLSAEPTHRDERQRLLERVSRDGFIDAVSGTRISATGRRFRIGGGIVWNLVDTDGVRHGQAACFTL